MPGGEAGRKIQRRGYFIVHQDSTALLEERHIVVYDLRVSGALEKLWRERSAWGRSAHMEHLYDRRVALVVKPGGAREVRR